MNQQPGLRIPVWYWVIAVLALLWNMMGCATFLMELFAQEAMMESMTEEQKQWSRAIPGWIYFLYALAVITGVAGSVGLIMRTARSVELLALSVAAVIFQMVYTTLIAGGLQVMGPSGLVMPVLVIFLSSAFLWFSWFAKGKGWLA